MTDLSQSEDTIEEVTTSDGSSEVTEDASDKLTPDHPRFKDTLREKKELETKVEQTQRELQELKTLLEEKDRQAQDRYKQNTGRTPEQIEALRIIKEELLGDGFLTKDDAAKSQSEINRTLTLTRLSDRYDGKNGLPKFDPIDVTVYAKRNGFGDNLEQAYKSMHFDTLVALEAKKQSINPPTSERPTSGGQNASSPEMTREQVAKMSPAEYAQHREKILTGIRTSL